MDFTKRQIRQIRRTKAAFVIYTTETIRFANDLLTKQPNEKFKVVSCLKPDLK